MTQTPRADIAAVSAGTATGSDSGNGIWLVTFADLILLLLAFFVLLFAMAEPDREALAEIARMLSTRGEAPIVAEIVPDPAERNIRAVDLPVAPARPEYLAGVLHDVLARDPALAASTVTLADDHVVVRPPPGVLGGTPDNPVALGSLAILLDRLDNQVRVVAPGAPADGLGDALARAVDAAEALRRNGYERPLTSSVTFADPGEGEDGLVLHVLGHGETEQ